MARGIAIHLQSNAQSHWQPLGAFRVELISSVHGAPLVFSKPAASVTRAECEHCPGNVLYPRPATRRRIRLDRPPSPRADPQPSRPATLDPGPSMPWPRAWQPWQLENPARGSDHHD
eukprot:923485-Rhodomonas_salina.3